MGSSAPEYHKVIVVGAGINGITLAKTYLGIDPLVDILLVDSELSIGGVWSKERVYPGLHYEVPVPLLDFSDLGMREEFGMKTWDVVTGFRVNEFLVCSPVSQLNAANNIRFDTQRSLIS
jgi:dimethylaniline monooxygenase (N-oxide forming)